MDGITTWRAQIKRFFQSYVIKTTLFISISTMLLFFVFIIIFYQEAEKIALSAIDKRLLNVGTLAQQFIAEKDLQNIHAIQEKVENLVTTNKQVSITNTKYQQQIQTIEESSEYLSIIHHLRMVRDSTILSHSHNSSEFGDIRYVYLVTPVLRQHQITAFLEIGNSNYDAKGLAPNFWQKTTHAGTVLQSRPIFINALQGSADIEKVPHISHEGSWVSAAFPIKNNLGNVIALLVLDFDTASHDVATYKLWSLIYWILPLGLFLTLLIAMAISRYLTKPIATLTAAAGRVRQGDFSVTIPQESHDQIGQLTATFNAMITDIRSHTSDLESLVQSYARFVPQEFLTLLNRKSIREIELGLQIERNMSVMFCDIRSFTTIVEQLSSAEAITFLNEYLQFIAPIIRLHQGYIDKYIGDAIMAIFPTNAQDAIQSAIQLVEETERYNSLHTAENRVPLQIAIGIHTGNLMLGTVGEERRMEATVISDTVNLSSRIDTLAKQLNVEILISESTKNSLIATQKIELRYVGKLRAKGKHVLIKIFEVLNHLPENEKQLKLVSAAKLTEAIELIEQGNFKNATPLLQELSQELPHDGVVITYLELCTEMKEKVLTNH